MEGIGKTILKQFEDMGAITNVRYNEDFLVDRKRSADDETYFNIGQKGHRTRYSFQQHAPGTYFL